MNLNDINGAVEDLIGHHGHQASDIVYLYGEKYGINGIDAIDGNLYVLSSDGKPAVSNVEYEQLKKTLISVKSEIEYALHSKKTTDVKRFYLENAIRIIDREVCEEE